MSNLFYFMFLYDYYTVFSVVKFSMGIVDMFRDFANILCKRESTLLCVCVYVYVYVCVCVCVCVYVCVCRKFGFLVPQNNADQDLEFGDAELSVLRAFTGINSLRILRCAPSRN